MKKLLFLVLAHIAIVTTLSFSIYCARLFWVEGKETYCWVAATFFNLFATFFFTQCYVLIKLAIRNGTFK